MPNYIANRLKVVGKDTNDIEDFLDFICGKDEETIIDFNNIIPMPQCLKDTEESTMVLWCVQYYLEQNNMVAMIEQLRPLLTPMKDFSILTKEALKGLYVNGEKYMSNYIECGYFTWYGWRIDNWGTKWNAFESEIIDAKNNEVDIKFYTAWSGITDLINVLADKFPHLYFEYDYADEDLGYNSGSGRGCVNDDGFWTCYHDNKSREAIETFIYAHNLNRDEFYKENKEWLCKEDWFNEKEWE